MKFQINTSVVLRTLLKSNFLLQRLKNWAATCHKVMESTRRCFKYRLYLREKGALEKGLKYKLHWAAKEANGRCRRHKQQETFGDAHGWIFLYSCQDFTFQGLISHNRFSQRKNMRLLWNASLFLQLPGVADSLECYQERIFILQNVIAYLIAGEQRRFCSSSSTVSHMSWGLSGLCGTKLL